MNTTNTCWVWIISINVCHTTNLVQNLFSGGGMCEILQHWNLPPPNKTQHLQPPLRQNQHLHCVSTPLNARTSISNFFRVETSNDGSGKGESRKGARARAMTVEPYRTAWTSSRCMSINDDMCDSSWSVIPWRASVYGKSGAQQWFLCWMMQRIDLCPQHTTA